MNEFTRLFSFLALIAVICQVKNVYSFSDGSKLAQGFSATRSVFCHRSINKRQPLHFNAQCNGYCEPNRHGELYYNLDVSATTYWLDLIMVNITAKENTDRSVTGFSIYAVDEGQMVAGSFVEDDNHILVGSCGDILAYNQETHGAFHKMADHDRKNITLKFQPDGFNHGEIRFVIWIVNNHSDIHYLESHPLTPSKNGTYGLDLPSVLHDIVDDVDIKDFEQSFEYRKKLGYRLDLEDPFSLFDTNPDAVALVPINMTSSASSDVRMGVTMGNATAVDTGVRPPDNSSLHASLLGSESSPVMHSAADDYNVESGTGDSPTHEASNNIVHSAAAAQTTASSVHGVTEKAVSSTNKTGNAVTSEDDTLRQLLDDADNVVGDGPYYSDPYVSFDNTYIGYQQIMNPRFLN